MNEILAPLWHWSAIDTWIVVAAALTAMACAVPGNFLLLRRQSMMGDALSHSVLLGIAVAFLVGFALRSRGLIAEDTYQATWHTMMFAGAIVIGVVTAALSQTVEQAGDVEASASLGVTYTSLFALGLLLIRLVADKVDLDPACVIYGNIEAVALDRISGWRVPRAVAVSGGVLVLNLALLIGFFKELRLATFDPGLAAALGFHPKWVHYALMSVTAVTVVAAFESVGSILVVAMLIVPPATAYLLTRRLASMIACSLLVAVTSAVLGHAAAITVPGAIFRPLGFTTVRDASTAGMIALAAGALFAAAAVFSPHEGLIRRLASWTSWQMRVVSEDLLGLLYRLEEMQHPARRGDVVRMLGEMRGWNWPLARFAMVRLSQRGWVSFANGVLHLTEHGRRVAQSLVRSHRLWEAYLARYLGLSDQRQHASAHEAEHFIHGRIREELAIQLDRPTTDPQGRDIPPPPDSPITS